VCVEGASKYKILSLSSWVELNAVVFDEFAGLRISAEFERIVSTVKVIQGITVVIIEHMKVQHFNGFY